MKQLINSRTKLPVQIGDSMYNTVYKEDMTVTGIVPPNEFTLNGAVMCRGEKCERLAPPAWMGTEWVDIPYAGPRGDPAVTFNTAVHAWKFAVGAEVLGTISHGARVSRRMYDADNGDPYYLVTFPSERSRLWGAFTVENEPPAASD